MRTLGPLGRLTIPLVAAACLGLAQARPCPAQDPKPRTSFASRGGDVQAVFVAPDGKTVAGVVQEPFGPDSKLVVRLWDAATGKEGPGIDDRAAMGLPPDSIAFSPDSKTLAVACGGYDQLGEPTGSVSLWDVAGGKERGTARTFPGFVSPPVFSPDGKVVAAGWGRVDPKTMKWVPGGVRVWDAATGRETLALKSAGGRVAFSPDGKTLATGAADGVRLWDAAAGREAATLRLPARGMNFLAFSRDGKVVAAGWVTVDPRTGKGGPGGVRVWDAASARETATLEGIGGPVALSPDGKTLATTRGREVDLWDVAAGKVRATLKGHTGDVTAVAFSPDGGTVATGCAVRDAKANRWVSGELRVWDAAKGGPRAVLDKGGSGVACVAFTPDGKFLVSGGWSGPVKLWDFPSVGTLGK